jgi:hypothetical protein
MVLVDPPPAIDVSETYMQPAGAPVQSAARTLIANSIVARKRTIDR